MEMEFRPLWVDDVFDDVSADKALRELETEKEEIDRIRAIAKAQKDEIDARVQLAEERYNRRVLPIKERLADYMGKVSCKETKTRKTYQLLSGKLVQKKAYQKLVPDKKALAEYLQESGQADYIKFTLEPAWGEYKKRLKIVGSAVINTDTGEVVPGVTVEDVPEEITWEE